MRIDKIAPASLKGTPMLGFLGSFSVNFEIPDDLGYRKVRFKEVWDGKKS